MKYITISTQDLKRLMELARAYEYAVFDGNDNTDGEGVWHCRVDFYENFPEDVDNDDPFEVFEFNEPNNEMSFDNKYKVYTEIRNYYAGEDIRCIAEEREVEIDDKDMDRLIDEYNKRVDMSVAERDLIENLVDKYAEDRKEK